LSRLKQAVTVHWLRELIPRRKMDFGLGKVLRTFERHSWNALERKEFYIEITTILAPSDH